jgi:cytidine deaminase
MDRMTMEKEMQQKMIEAALAARKQAYTPYSHYQVGAALLANDGTIFTGCNIENAAYTPTVCAERVAIFKAVSEGYRDFVAIAVATADGGSPCGVCRQVMSEFMLDAQVLIVDCDGNIIVDTSGRDLLPYAFGPQNLDR